MVPHRAERPAAAHDQRAGRSGLARALLHAGRNRAGNLNRFPVGAAEPALGAYLLGVNVTPVKAVDLVEKWLFEQGLIQ